MRTFSIVFVLAMLCVASASLAMNRLNPERPENLQQTSSFRFIDVYVDAHEKPLGAFQFDARLGNGVELVGLEGGDHPAFHTPPKYDPKALSQSRVIVADYSLEGANARGAVRIARLHVFVPDTRQLDPTIKLSVASSAAGKAIDASISWKIGDTQ